MKLATRPLALRLAHTWGSARTRNITACETTIVELAGPNGVFGRGEAAPISRYNESAQTVAAFYQRVDPHELRFDDLAASMAYLNTVSPDDLSAKCGLNIALLDGAAKHAGKSLHDFLGFSFRENHHVTSFTIGIDQPSVIHKKVLAAAKYPILKMKVGSPDDREHLRILRDAAPTKPVRVDANEGWKTREHALEMIEWLAADKHVQFVEQPMPAAAPAADWVWLKERSPLPLFADESYHLAADASRAVECFHGVNVKLTKTGGVTGAIEALTAARNAGLKTMLGCMIETSVLISAAAHLAELCDYLDLDGNLLITNDPYRGVTADDGVLSFASAVEHSGLQVAARD